MKPLTQNYSVEISLESINNNDIAKNNACEEIAFYQNLQAQNCQKIKNILRIIT